MNGPRELERQVRDGPDLTDPRVEAVFDELAHDYTRFLQPWAVRRATPRPAFREMIDTMCWGEM